MKTVIIVKDLELGWDNIVGVFNPEVYSIEELRIVFPEDGYVIQEYTFQIGLLDYV